MVGLAGRATMSEGLRTSVNTKHTIQTGSAAAAAAAAATAEFQFLLNSISRAFLH